MRQKPVTGSSPSEQLAKAIRERPQAVFGRGGDPYHSGPGLRGESSIAELCRREGRSGRQIPPVQAGLEPPPSQPWHRQAFAFVVDFLLPDHLLRHSARDGRCGASR